MASRRYPNAEERFWCRVSIGSWSSCWRWTGYRNPLGYGRLRGHAGTKILAHRFAFELVHGPVPRGRYVMHRCDNPACVNVAHLRLGTIADNNADRNAKERQARGRDNGRAVLADDEVRAIRSAFASGTSIATIANAHHVHSKTIYQVVNGRTWRHLP